MSKIYLGIKPSKNRGLIALVDDEDYDWLMRWGWYALKDHKTFYAVRRPHQPVLNRIDRRPIIRMHRIVMERYHGKFNNLVIDHVNKNGLDNRKENLRICSISQNSMNSIASKRKHKGYRGVQDRGGYYEVKIRYSGKRHYLGTFKDVKDAVKCYDDAAIKHHGEFAVLNR